jgi:hypothetical protein
MLRKSIIIDRQAVEIHVYSGGQDYARIDQYEAVYNSWPTLDAWKNGAPSLAVTRLTLSSAELKKLIELGVGNTLTIDDEVDLLASGKSVFAGAEVIPTPRHINDARREAEASIKAAASADIDATHPKEARSEAERVINSVRAGQIVSEEALAAANAVLDEVRAKWGAMRAKLEAVRNAATIADVDAIAQESLP